MTFGDGDTSPRLVEVPLLEDRRPSRPRRSRCRWATRAAPGWAPSATAPVTIVDDDQPRPPPPPALHDRRHGRRAPGVGARAHRTRRADFRSPPTGASPSPGPVAAGQRYEVAVATQPSNPDQVCAVEHGAGTVGSANVSDIAVHCATTPRPPGSIVRSAPTAGCRRPSATGQGEAVVIQPERRHRHRRLARHGRHRRQTSRSRATTRPATSIRRSATDGHRRHRPGRRRRRGLGRRADARRRHRRRRAHGQGRDPEHATSALVRYMPDGMPDPGFGNGGIMKTDVLAGHGSQANAVAVQPDGKIVVAGSPRRRRHRHRLRARRATTPTGARQTFGDHGIMTTDLGTQLRRRPRARPPVRRQDRRRRHRGRRPRPGPLHRRGHLDRPSAQAARRSPTSAPRRSPTASRSTPTGRS